MLVQVCAPGDVDAGTGACLHPVWVEYVPSVFAGWTLADWGQFAAGICTLVAVAYVIRWVHVLGNQQ